MPKINPRIKSIDDLLGLDTPAEETVDPTPSLSLPTK
jgi:ParB family transcriptional regulator, chromosome partitioning protein